MPYFPRLFSVLFIFMAACSPPQESAQRPSSAPQAPAPQGAAQATSQSTNGAIPPDTILFASKYGDVTYTHKKHYERLGGDCSVCHTKVFPQSREPLNYKKALHRAAEASRTSCAYCHAVGGTSFAADSNCIKCHAQKEY